MVTDSSLLPKFQAKDTSFGVTRETVKKIAALHELCETELVHMALSRLAKDETPAYEADEGPVAAREASALRKRAALSLPKARVLRKETLF